MKFYRTLLIPTLIIICSVSIVYGLVKAYDRHAAYVVESKIHTSLLQYSPSELQPQAIGNPRVPASSDETLGNRTMLNLQAKFPDVVGWLSIPNTSIDYPFAQAADNDYYLHHDIEGNYAIAGTVFLDYRCNADLSSQNTIIHGHNMKNGSMFGTMLKFQDEAFFTENQRGFLYLPNTTLELRFFALMIIDAETENEVYRTELSTEYHDYIKANARYYRDIEITAEDRIVTLSTCSYEFRNARMVLVAAC